MPAASFLNLFGVSMVALAAPLILGWFPRLRIPSVVLEIVVGILIGPAVLGWIRVDLPVQVLSVLGLAFLLFLAGMEIDLHRLRGKSLELAAVAFAISVGLALVVGLLAFWGGLANSPLLVGIILLATSLGLVIPVLKDAGQSLSSFGQLVIAAASLADFGAVILLSLFFGREARSPITKLILLLGFALVVALLVLSARRIGARMRVSALLVRLQDTTAEIRIRAAILLLVALVALAQRLGLETILAAFLAGAALRLIDQDQFRTHPNFSVKLEAIGYGFLIPVFFVSSGLAFDLRSLLASPVAVASVPVFLLALLLVRAAPAVAYRARLGLRGATAAGLLQATSLPFIVAATAIGIDLGLMRHSTAAALVGAGLVSVVAFPALALTLLHKMPPSVPGGAALQSPQTVSRGGD